MKREQLTVPFVRGLDVGNESPQLTDKLLRVENAVVNRRGDIDKRRGKTQVAGSYSEDVLCSHGDRLTLVGSTIKEMDSAGTFDTVDSDVELAKITAQSLLGTENGDAKNPQLAVFGDMLYISRGGVDEVHFDAISRSTGVAMQDRYTVAAGSTVTRLVYDSSESRIYAFYIDSGMNLRGFAVTSTGSRGAVHDFGVTDSWPDALSGGFDAALVDDGKIIIAYRRKETITEEGVAAVAASDTVTTTGSAFLATDVGETLTLSNSAASPSNDGAYPVATFTDVDNVIVTATAPLLTDEAAAGDLDMSLDRYWLVVGAVTCSGATLSGSTVTEVARPQLRDVAVCKWTTGEAFIAYWQNTTTRDIRGVAYDDADPPAVSSTGTDTSIDTFTTDTIGQLAPITTTDGDIAQVYYTQTAQEDLTELMLHRGTYDYDGGAYSCTEATVCGDLSFWGRPVQDAAGNVYLPCHHNFGYYGEEFYSESSIQRSYFLMRDDLTNWLKPVARFFPGEACETSYRGLKTGEATLLTLDAADKWVCLGKQLANITTDAKYSALSERVELHLLTLDTTVAWTKPLEVNARELLIPNGIPLVVGSGVLHEAGPLVYPEYCSATPTGAGDTWPLAEGSWAYRFTYEIYLNGNVYESAPSPLVTADVTVNDVDGHNTVELACPSLKITMLADDDAKVRVVIYRSTEAGGKTYTRITSIDNDPDAATVTFSDTGAFDNADATQEPTANNTVLQDDPPYPLHIATVWKSRLFFAHPQYTDRQVRYTKEFVEGYGPQFSDKMYFAVSPQGGDITGFGAFGDHLAIFKRRALFVTSGIGKNSAGGGEDFAKPTLVSPNIGAINERGIVACPAGVLFQTDDCIMMLDAGLGMSPVGRPVKHHTDSLTIADSVCFPEINSVLFVTDGACLVYNYLFGVWSTWVNMAGDGCAVANGTLYLKDESTGLWEYDTTTYLDDGATLVALAVETPWIMPGGPNAFNRVWEVRLLGHSGGARTVRVKIAYDHDPTWVDTLDVNTTDLGAFDPDEHYGTMATDYTDKALLLRFRGSLTKCSAIRFRIEEVAA